MDSRHCNAQTCLETIALIQRSRWESLAHKLGWKPVHLNLATRVVKTSHIFNSTTYKFFCNIVWTNDQIFKNLILKDITFGGLQNLFLFPVNSTTNDANMSSFPNLCRARKLLIVLDLRTRKQYSYCFFAVARNLNIYFASSLDSNIKQIIQIQVSYLVRKET